MENEVIYFNFDNYNFFSSLILKNEFWKENGKMRKICIQTNAISKDAQFAVAIPYRSLLAVGNANNPKSLDTLEQFINESNKSSKLLNPETDEEIRKCEEMTKEEWNNTGLDGMWMFELRRWVTNDIYVLENGKWNIKLKIN